MKRSIAIYITFFAAILVILTGSAVLLGWYSHNISLIQIHQSFVPMQYNTALGFIFGGLGLLALARSKLTLIKVIGLVLITLGSLTLAEYIFNVDFNIDQLFMTHYIDIQTSNPGRMAPNTALCFSLVGFALIAQLTNNLKKQLLWTSSLGFIVIALGVVAFGGYISNMETAYGWGNYTRMAVHTACSFIIIGIGLVAFTLGKNLSQAKHLPFWLPISIGIGSFTITILMWQSLHNMESQMVTLIGDKSINIVDESLLIFGLLLTGALVMAFRYYEIAVERLNISMKGEQELSRILEESLNEIYIFDTDTLCFLHVNLGAKLNLDYGQDELEKMTPLDIKPEYTKEQFLTLINPLLTGSEKLLQFTTIHQRKDGSQYPVEINLQLSTFNSQPAFVAIILDISLRSQAEKALYLATKIIQRSPVVAITWSIEAQSPIVFATENIEQLFGYTAEELIQTKQRYIELIYSEDRERTAQELDYYISLIEISRFQHNPYRIVTKDGHIKWIDDITYIHRDNQGAVTHLEGIVYDITTRVEAEQEQSKLRDQIEHSERLKSMGVLAGGIAHDFNNILTAIMGNATLAERQAINNPHQTQKYLANIVSSSERAADLCKQMLAYSGKGKFVVRAINLSALVKDISRLLEVAIVKGISLNYRLADNLPAVLVDVAQIQQVIMNLVINASDAIGDKNGIITISTALMQADETYLGAMSIDDGLVAGPYVYLEVSDTGCGMDNQTQLKIFEPFFTTKKAGHGLGMSAVLGIVRGHHGAIKVYSELGQGTTFKMLLPVSQVEIDTNNSADNSQISSTPLRGTVLVVDDEESIRESATLILENIGFDTVTATDGEDGIVQYRNNQADIVAVLLDMTMPKMDGKDCFRELRRINKDVKVILLSGYNEQEATSLFVGKGLAGFIQKPYSHKMLTDKFRSILIDE